MNNYLAIGATAYDNGTIEGAYGNRRHFSRTLENQFSWQTVGEGPY